MATSTIFFTFTHRSSIDFNRVIIWLPQWNPKPQLYDEVADTKQSIRIVNWHLSRTNKYYEVQVIRVAPPSPLGVPVKTGWHI
jgi:hypothetical protein